MAKKINLEQAIVLFNTSYWTLDDIKEIMKDESQADKDSFIIKAIVQLKKQYLEKQKELEDYEEIEDDAPITDGVGMYDD